jgi:hypothetical protein
MSLYHRISLSSKLTIYIMSMQTMTTLSIDVSDVPLQPLVQKDVPGKNGVLYVTRASRKRKISGLAQSPLLERSTTHEYKIPKKKPLNGVQKFIGSTFLEISLHPKIQGKCL